MDYPQFQIVAKKKVTAIETEPDNKLPSGDLKEEERYDLH
jgi:hypothetical protein